MLRTLGQTVGVPSEAPFFGAHYRITQVGPSGAPILCLVVGCRRPAPCPLCAAPQPTNAASCSSPAAPAPPLRLLQEADGSRRLVAFNAEERGQDNRVNVFEYDEAMQLLHRWAAGSNVPDVPASSLRGSPPALPLLFFCLPPLTAPRAACHGTS